MAPLNQRTGSTKFGEVKPTGSEVLIDNITRYKYTEMDIGFRFVAPNQTRNWVFKRGDLEFNDVYLSNS